MDKSGHGKTKKVPCLMLDGISKVFGGLLTLDDFCLTVEGGRRAIIGPNGAGKTTLFNLISGKLKPTAGHIFYCGDNITNMPEQKRAAMGIARTFQITNLFKGLTVLENLLLACQALDRKRKFVMFRFLYSYGDFVNKSLELLERFALRDKQNELVKNLSYGDQRKIEITLALAGHPRLLLLDEPTAGLSPGETRSMTELLQGLDPEITVLLIEHDMDVAFELCEQISVLYKGKLLASGSRQEISSDYNVRQIYLGEDVISDYHA